VVDDRGRESRKLSHMDAIGALGHAWDDLEEEGEVERLVPVDLGLVAARRWQGLDQVSKLSKN